MLVIHWTKHNNTADILANGVRQATRTFECYSVDKAGNATESREKVKGIWCYPYTRNKTLNNQWKRNLKIWERQRANFNGIVIRLTKEDFPLYAGLFLETNPSNPEAIMESMEDLKRALREFPRGTSIDPQKNEMDTDEFEIILLKRIKPHRIIKIIKDRPVLKTNRPSR